MVASSHVGSVAGFFLVEVLPLLLMLTSLERPH